MRAKQGRNRAIDTLYRRQVLSQPYVTLLDRIHQHVLPRTYLEIGVESGRTLNLALPGTRIVGVDPAPRLRFPLASEARVIELTSDDFFASWDLDELFGGLPLDLALIDGLHQFEVALRDFRNIERASGRATTVLIHDCYPVDAETSGRECKTEFWSGDVWKLIVCLVDFRPDLDVVVADVAPTGLGIVRGLDPNSTVLFDCYDEICDRFVPLPFEWLTARGQADALHRIDADWAGVLSHLPSVPFRLEDTRSLVTRRAIRTLPALRPQILTRLRNPLTTRSAPSSTPHAKA